MKNKYYSLVRNGNEADINIFGDITSWAWEELGEVSASNLSKQLDELQDVSTINVHISSYGGEVKEGLAIYNSLKNHKAKIRTYCDGFACSIASVIFMAGDERVMSKASLLMIHNAWTGCMGNADELRKQADDLDKITQASINAYMEHINISEKQLKKLMDNESWLTYDECLEMGFATSVNEDSNDKVSQSVKSKLIDLILQAQKEDEDSEDDEDKETDIDVEDKEDEEPSKEADSEEDDPEKDDEEGPVDEDEPTDDKENNDNPEKDEDEVTNEKVVAFFNAIVKM